MAIVNTIDEKDKIIYTTCVGVMEEKDFDDYLVRIWGHDKYYYFNELFDTVSADWSLFNFSYLLDFARAAATLNTLNPNTRLAWVVLEGKQKELTDFYKAAKSLTKVKSRELQSFESRKDALLWLKQD
ncbi:MAG: hypothetical protein OEX07_16380 [Gammaproteobacteria bacterium]|nr:hypothetical protein [Gammaproteobacteria bacterium]